MTIVEVNSQETNKAFLTLPILLYKDNPYWVRPLDEDILKVFDPKQNIAFENGECIRWILKDKNNNTIGRVAAFFQQKDFDKEDDQTTGGMGYFECIDDQKAAYLLFDTCKEWLQSKGAEAMEGPINFGSRDQFWGLLIDGFDKEPSYQMNYHFPYYQKIFEDYGFKTYFEQYTFYKQVAPLTNETVIAKAHRLMENEDYSFKILDKKQLTKFAEDFRIIYNNSFAKTEGLTEMTEKESQKIMQRMKPILDPRLLHFAYYKDIPIGFGIFIPELNRLFKYVDGKMNLLGKLKFAYYRWKGKSDRILGIAFGVSTRFHGRGLEAAISLALEEHVINKGTHYRDIELNWIGDFNPPMIKLIESLDFDRHKTHITYRKLFDESKPFNRHPIRTYGKK